MAWGGNHFSPLLLMYRQAEGFSAVEANLSFAVYIVGLVPGLMLAGPLSDRHGRRPLIRMGLLLGVVASAVLASGADHVVVLCAGRLVSGVSVAIAMAAGSSWLKELSAPPYDETAEARTGARRASMTITAGFAGGAGVSGVLAQWGPWPTVFPYLVHIALVGAAAAALAGAPREPGPAAARGPLLADLRIPLTSRRRFLRVIVPMAPWVFACPAMAYVIAPALVEDRVGGGALAFATVLTVLTLVAGVAVQSVFRPVSRLTGGREMLAGLLLVVAGVGALVGTAATLSPALAVPTAVLLGAGYGLCLVSGLAEVQAMADPHDLAGLTAVYYSLTYLGFVLPVVLSALVVFASYIVMLTLVGTVCVCCCLLIARSLRC